MSGLVEGYQPLRVSSSFLTPLRLVQLVSGCHWGEGELPDRELATGNSQCETKGGVWDQNKLLMESGSGCEGAVLDAHVC